MLSTEQTQYLDILVAYDLFKYADLASEVFFYFC
jgi:hypothetical protein